MSHMSTAEKEYDMQNLKKTLVALLAAIATVFTFGVGTASADYGADVTVSGSTATVTFHGLTPGNMYRVRYDDTNVSSVVLAKYVYSNEAAAHQDGTLTATYTFRDSAKPGDQIAAVLVDANNNDVVTATITVPATGTNNGGTTTGGTTSNDTIAKTGAAVAPYGVAVVLLAAAGIALFAVRKSTARR